MTEEFGSGIHIHGDARGDEYEWDFDISESGDLRTVSQIDELQKDLSFNTAINLQETLGGPLTPTKMNRIRSKVRQTMEDDDRISRIVSLDVSRVDGRANTVQVNTTLSTVEGLVELIFEVDR